MKKTFKNHLILIIVTLILVSLSFPVQAFDASQPPQNQTENQPYTTITGSSDGIQQFEKYVPLYFQAGVTINFFPTENKTQNTAPTYGGLYIDSSSNNFYSTQLYAIDTYNIQVSVRYTAYVTQIVTLDYTSSNQTDQDTIYRDSFQVNGYGFDIILHVKTSEFPHIPTAQEIANATNQGVQSSLGNTTAEFKQVIADMQTRDILFQTLSVGVGAAFVVLLIFFSKDHSKLRRLEKQNSIGVA
ncbi:MAG: hypothetical protein ACQCN3_02450 [Candidatus Bathyarchaeia archaeon]|jgi:hypothetical protein